MSLVVKCQCGMILEYDIRSPGLIVVHQCRDCQQRIEDKVSYTTGNASPVGDVLIPGQEPKGSGPGTNEFDGYTKRIMRTQKSKLTGPLLGGGDDDNDPRNPRDRRL